MLVETLPERAIKLQMGDCMLRLHEVEAFTGASKTTIYRWIETEGFPHPRRMGPRIVAWRWSELNAWLNARERDWDPEEVR